MYSPKIIDDDETEIRAEIDKRIVRSWEYHTEAERRVKMRMAHEFAEGWFQADLDLRKKNGQQHMHVSGATVGQHIDDCAICGRDLRHEIHAI